MRVIMRSCVWRQEMRDATLESFRAVNIPVEVTLDPCDAPTRPKGIMTALSALTPCAGQNTLVLEDDLIAAPVLPLWLKVAERQDRPISLCTMRWHMHTPEVTHASRTKQPIPTGLFPIGNRLKWWGSQAMYLPAPIVDLALARYERFGLTDHPAGGFDTWLRTLFNTNGITLMVAIPNPVQHRDPPPTFGHTPKAPRLSKTFGKPGTLDLEALRSSTLEP